MPRRPNDKPKHNDVLAAAMGLHDRGLWVVPCKGKKLLCKNWPKERQGKEQLTDALKRAPDLNIAIVLNQSDWIDVECDSPAAEASLQKLFGREIPPTPTWESSRGKHRLFVRPDGLPKQAVIVVDDIEFRIGNGKGASSIVPPSMHSSGKQYRWLPGLSLDDVEPAELPPTIIERLRNSVPQPNTEGAGNDIPEGKRNASLFQKANALRRAALPQETILTALLDLNQRLCRPPLPEQEVRGIVASVMTNDGPKAKEGFLQRLMQDIELWHDENDNPFVTLSQDGHRENWLIDKRSRPFRRWLSKKFYDVTGEMIKSDGLSDIAALLEGKAVFDGPRHKLFRRIAEHEGNLYLDLCDEAWRAVEINADGWRAVDNPPVKFRRAKAMHPLPLPVKTEGASLQRLLLPFLNIRIEQWPLVATWLVAALRPVGPYPVLKLLGEQGSAKTTTARVLRALVDPNAAPVRAEPRDTRDLMIAANNGWVLCLDNLSTIKSDLSDALCRMATGGGFATRTLYSDDDETIFDAQRPVVLTSIEDIGTRSDLLERSLIIDLPTIYEEGRRTEKTFWRDFEKARPYILGALLDVVASALRRLPEIEQKGSGELPRLADFHVWGEAAETALGIEPGTFAEAYAANRESATHVALESSPVVAALLRLLHKNPHIEDTATGLLEKLCLVDSELTRQPGWPKAPRVLSAILKRVAPNLRQVGVIATQDTRGSGSSKAKVWRIKQANPSPAKKKLQVNALSAPSGPNKLGEYLKARGARVGGAAK